MNFNKMAHGFTLIEVIASVVLFGILAILTSISLAKIFEGYFFTRDNADTTMKSQVALTRLVKEFSSIDGVSNGTDTSLTYSYYKNGVSIPNRTVSWSGIDTAPLLLGGNILAENINDFELSYHTSYSDSGDNTWNGSEKMIGITLKMTGALDVVSTFTFRVSPRNL